MFWVLWVVDYRRPKLHNDAKDLMPSTGCRMQRADGWVPACRRNPISWHQTTIKSLGVVSDKLRANIQATSSSEEGVPLSGIGLIYTIKVTYKDDPNCLFQAASIPV